MPPRHTPALAHLLGQEAHARASGTSPPAGGWTRAMRAGSGRAAERSGVWGGGGS